MTCSVEIRKCKYDEQGVLEEDPQLSIPLLHHIEQWKGSFQKKLEIS